MKKILQILLLLTLINPYSTINCKTDEICKEELGQKYHCKKNTCKRKSIISTLDFISILGLFLNIFFNIFTNSIGISGSGLVFCILIFLFEFDTKEALPIYKMCNLLASSINVIFLLFDRRKDDFNRLYLDFDLSGFVIPMLVAGSMIGILINELLPAFYLLLFICIILLTVCRSTFFKLKNELENNKKKEKEISETEVLEVNNTILEKKLLGENKTEINIKKIIKKKTQINLFSIFIKNSLSIFLTFLSFTILIFGNLSKGNPSNPSNFFPQCSFISFLIYTLSIISCVLTSLIPYKRIKNINKRKLRTLGFYSFLAGIVSAVGISGSILFTSNLVLLNLEQKVVRAVSGMSLFLISLATVIQFELVGFLDFQNSVFIAVTSVVGSVIGNFGISHLFERYKGSSIVTKILFFIAFLSVLLMPLIIYNEIKVNKHAFELGGIC